MWDVRMHNDLSIGVASIRPLPTENNDRTALDPESLLFRLQELAGTLDKQGTFDKQQDLISSEALERALTVLDR